MKCDIYRSSKKDGMYLYVASRQVQDGQVEQTSQPHDSAAAVATLPQGLQGAFGTATWVMSLEIDADRKLAQVQGAQVLASIAQKGYFLQLPPEGLINPHAVAPEGLRGA